MVEPALRPVLQDAADIDTHVFESGLVAVGAFRCRPSHPLFLDSGPIRNHCVVFPRSSSVIRPSGFRRFVGSQSAVSVYNAGQEYRRAVVSPVGDFSDYFGVDDTTLRQIAADRRPRFAEAERPFPVSHLPSRPEWYYWQRQIFRRATSKVGADPLEIEEQVLLLIGALLDAMPPGTPTPEPPESLAMRRRRDLVEQAQVRRATHAAHRLTLRDLGMELGVSPFHLCRTFRAMTGITLHRFRERLRLAAALDRLDDGDDLSQIALDVGYSSHSHLTAAFRRAFGVTPSAARRPSV